MHEAAGLRHQPPLCQEQLRREECTAGLGGEIRGKKGVTFSCLCLCLFGMGDEREQMGLS